ncbi:unnamed protein product [Peniophora sp. CBMAI 1063]|nr:unnamed protein product [Peniophora sp. CBMAI 1063]
MATQGRNAVTGNSRKASSKPESLNHLLNFTLPPRQTQQLQPIPRRSRKTGNQHGIWNKERFIMAQYRFVMNPEGDYTVHFADPDIYFQWQDILQIIIPRNSALASATGAEGHSHEEGHTTCPICLSPPTAPRMTKCGHVFCFSCILHYLSTSDNLKWVRCPICFDSVNERQLKAVKWFDAPSPPEDRDAPAASSSSTGSYAGDGAPRPGTTLHMRLMERPQITTLALPRSPTWPSDLLPPHQAPWHFLPDIHTFSKFMLATPTFLTEALQADLRDLAAEKRSMLGLGDTVSAAFIDAAEQRLHDQIAKATALDTELLRASVERALAIQHDIEERAALNKRRLAEQQRPSTPATEDTPEVVTPTQRGPRQRRNINPPPPSTQTYYYYQASSGAPVFLHPLDIKILHSHFAGYTSFPDAITVRVENTAEGSVDADLRKRCKYLGHLPEGADVVFVEADLSDVVGQDGLRAFEGPLKARKSKRESKVKKDDRARVRAEEREREKFAEANWRQTGVYIPAVRAPSPVGFEEESTEPAVSASPPVVSGAWGARSFASTMAAPAVRRQQPEHEADEWELDAAWHELEARSLGGSAVSNGGGGRKKRGRQGQSLVVLGNGPGRRR